MNSPTQDWMLKLEGMLGTLKRDWETTKTTVLESTYAARLDRIEEKLDQVLAELRNTRQR